MESSDEDDTIGAESSHVNEATGTESHDAHGATGTKSSHANEAIGTQSSVATEQERLFEEVGKHLVAACFAFEKANDNGAALRAMGQGNEVFGYQNFHKMLEKAQELEDASQPTDLDGTTGGESPDAIMRIIIREDAERHMASAQRALREAHGINAVG